MGSADTTAEWPRGFQLSLSASARVLTATGLMIATALQAADALIVNVAVPELQNDLGGGLELGAWIMTSYLCAAAVMAPFTSWLRRRYGPWQLFRGAVLAFITASVLCGVATSGLEIIAERRKKNKAPSISHEDLKRRLKIK